MADPTEHTFDDPADCKTMLKKNLRKVSQLNKRSSRLSWRWVMGALKRPKLRLSRLAEGGEFYFYRRPSTGSLKKVVSADEETPESKVPQSKANEKPSRVRKEPKG